jgi:hypothetical protein
VTGHVSGLPVEELLPTLLSGGGAWVILRLTSLGARATVAAMTRLVSGGIEGRCVAGERDPDQRRFVDEAVDRTGGVAVVRGLGR